MEPLLKQGRQYCPFLCRTSTAVMRQMASTVAGPSASSPVSTSTAAGHRNPPLTGLQKAALHCPVMRRHMEQQLAETPDHACTAGQKSQDGRRTFAAPSSPAMLNQTPARAAEMASLEDVHRQAGVEPGSTKSSGSKCPHAAAVRAVEEQIKNLKPRINSPAYKFLHNTPSTIDAQRAKFNYANFYLVELDKKRQDKSYRFFNNINRLASEFPLAHTENEKHRVTVWCSNDYLNMSRHPSVIRSISETVKKYGSGAGGTPNIAGFNQNMINLQHSLADLHRKEAALVFGSCYAANDAALTILGSKLSDCVIFSDASNHASMIQGIRHSQARKVVFKHNDLIDLEQKLASVPLSSPKIIAFESVYSMCGSVGPIREICNLAEKYGAITFLDEVHAVGLYGNRGAGVAEHLDFSNGAAGGLEAVMPRIDIISGTLGKAYGVVGGYIAGQKDLIDMIRCYAPQYIFSTALPPGNLVGAMTAIEHLKKSNQERQMQQVNTQKVKQAFTETDIPHIPNPTHIVPLLVGSAEAAKAASDELLYNHNIYVQAINYPTVPVGQERLRITPTPGHTDQHITQLVEAVQIIWSNLGLKYTTQWKALGGHAGVGTGISEPLPLWTDAQLAINANWSTSSQQHHPAQSLTCRAEVTTEASWQTIKQSVF